MSYPIIGFIGYGEAAYLISRGLKDEGLVKQYTFDVNANDTVLGPKVHERVNELKLNLTSSLEELCHQCDIIFCATSAKVAEKIASDVKRFLKPSHLYIDINASSPMVKESIAVHVNEAGAEFVDAAVMESVPLNKHKVPMFISGNGAKRFLKLGSSYGMNLRFISEKPGSSSGIKMFRSIFMKGITSLLLETLQASEKYGVSEVVMESLNQSITQKPLEESANMLINRTAIHAERRVSEMDEVIKTLEMLEVDSILSQAVKSKLQSLVNSGIKEKLNSEVPNHYQDVLQALDS